MSVDYRRKGSPSLFSNENCRTILMENVRECSEAPVDYEKAIKAAGFGKYNIMIILTLFPPALALHCSTSVMSYVFPFAQCDLNLTLENKGMLNSITYFGMLSSGFLWGFLTDTLGRKKLMIAVYMLDGILVFFSGFSQNFIYLTIVKFFEGFVINGGCAAVVSYTNEFHYSKQRRIIPIINGMLVQSGGVILPLLCWLILRNWINLTLFNEFLELKSWNILLLVTAIPSFTAGFIYIILPESPKFLMTAGKNEQALQTFAKIYQYNTGNPKSKYPVKVLIKETKLISNIEHEDDLIINKSHVLTFRRCFRRISLLFGPPHRTSILLILTMELGLSMGLNTTRLWLPQFFSAINDYQPVQEDIKYNFCESISTLSSKKSAANETCFVNYNNDQVYINNAICSSIAIVTLLCIIPVLRKLGKKIVLSASAIISGLCMLSIYYANNIALTIALFSLHLGFTCASSNTLIGTVVDLFPTTIRAMTLSLVILFGRIGSSIGNLVFPRLLSFGCHYPFLLLGCISIGVAVLAILLPNTDKSVLK